MKIIQKGKEKLKMEKKFDKKKVIIFLTCFASAFVLLLLNSKCSPLSCFNENVDYQWYVTMGGGVLNGKILYKDLFEQKGPIIYFLYSLFILTQNVQITVFIFEIICFTFFLYFSYKVLRRYAGDGFACLFSIFFGALLVLLDIFSDFGGAVEEYCLPVFAWLILLFLEYFIDGKPLGKLRSFLIGFYVSLIFWSKYFTVIVPAVFLIMWLIASLKNKKFKEFGISVLFMFLGFMLVTVPILIYFGVNGAFYDLFYCYFYLNMTSYSNHHNRLQMFFSEIFTQYGFLSVLCILIAVLFVAVFVYYFIKHKKEFFVFLPGLVCFIVTICLSTAYVYYALSFYPFLIFILIILKSFTDKFKKAVNYVCFGLGVVFVGVFFGLSISNGVKLASKTEESYAQFSIVDAIQDYDENQDSVYCYEIMDYGFYNLLEITPNEKYYVKNNFSKQSFPEMYEYMENVIKSQKYFFVITDTDVLQEESDFLLKYYEVCKTSGNFVLLTVKSN